AALNRAEELLKQATKGPVDRPGQVYFNLGQLYTQGGRFADAIQALHESLRIEPADERAFYALANAYRRMGHVKAATATEARFQKMSQQHVLLQSLEARISHEPKDLATRLRLARLCRDMGLTDEAIHHY